MAVAGDEDPTSEHLQAFAQITAEASVKTQVIMAA
jgi:hypothetical protein